MFDVAADISMIFIFQRLGRRYLLGSTGEEVAENIGECQVHRWKSAVLQLAIASQAGYCCRYNVSSLARPVKEEIVRRLVWP